MSKYLVSYYPASALVWLRYVLQTVVMAAIFLPRMGMRSAAYLVTRPADRARPDAGAEQRSLRRRPASHADCRGGEHRVPRADHRGGRRRPAARGARQRANLVCAGGGFTGVLLIIRPGGSAFTWWAFLPLGCAFMFASYQILTRKLAGRDDPITTLFIPGLAAVLVIPPVFPGSITGLPSVPLHFLMLAAIGVLVQSGIFF
jgi:threonine/homoserine efflux transporter RhtA